MPAPLQVEQAVKIYRQGTACVRALDGVSLAVEEGQFVAIMGASGSGKSTLLHAIAGLIDIDGGRVVVAGQDLSQLSDVPLTKFRRRNLGIVFQAYNLGIVFQAYNLIPGLSAEENIRLPASGGETLDARVDDLLDRLGISGRRHHKPGALSGGEQQRVAIARALVCDPSLVLADEPTGSLDSVTGTQICRLMRDLVDEQRRSIIVVTHEPHVAMWADRIYVLKDGTNLAEFTTDGRRDPQQIAQQYQELVNTEALA